MRPHSARDQKLNLHHLGISFPQDCVFSAKSGDAFGDGRQIMSLSVSPSSHTASPAPAASSQLSGPWSLHHGAWSAPWQTLAPDRKTLYVRWLSARSAPNLHAVHLQGTKPSAFSSSQITFHAAVGVPRSAPVLGSGLLCPSYPSAGLTSPRLPLSFLFQHPLVPIPSAKPNGSKDSDNTHAYFLCARHFASTGSGTALTVVRSSQQPPR